MSLSQSEIKEDMAFKILKTIEPPPEITWREIALRLGMSLGGVNYCLRALIEKGIIKVKNFSDSSSKLCYCYLLTPKGIVEKGRLTSRFLERKMKEYETLKKEIDEIQKLNQVISKKFVNKFDCNDYELCLDIGV
jgi:EPS-associated MarR family transcriptional regulator